MITKPSKTFSNAKGPILGILILFVFAIVFIFYFNQPLKSESKLLINAKLTVACKEHGGIIKDSVDSSTVDCKNGKRIYYNNLYGDEVLEEFNKLKEGIKNENP